jgi:integrase/recombinase XerD
MKYNRHEDEKVKVTVVLDRRNEKKDGTYPVKIRVWDGNTQKAKRYGTSLSVSEGDFHTAWETVRPRKEYLPLKKRLQALLTDNQAAVDQLEHFTFDLFERKASIPKGDAANVIYHLERRSVELQDEGRIAYGKSYGSTANALMEFINTNKLLFAEVTPKFLQALEDHMINQGKSYTTVGVYARNLRAVFNSAIESNDASRDQYPFGKMKYVIPAGANKKKALTTEQLKKLRDLPLNTDGQERARAIFLFSYASNGMNMKDIAFLKWSQVTSETIEFVREKSRRTKKSNRTVITVFMNEFHRDVLTRYGSNPEQSTYVFPVLKEGMSALEQYKAVQGFTRSINQYLEKISSQLDLPEISTYWARHSFATVAVRKGASMEFMRESLGHSDMKTTLNYFAGFDDESKRKLANTIMDF